MVQSKDSAIDDIIMFFTGIISSRARLVGKYGPHMMFAYACTELFNKPTTLCYFILGAIANVLINFAIKIGVKQPRPMTTEQARMFSLSTKRYADLGISDGMLSANIYGMPSGHLQTAFYIITYLWISLKNMGV